MLDEAINLANKGFRIIPCLGKKPVIPKWQINATSNIETIKKQWEKEDYNIGILTGKDGGNIIVIDCDIKEDINGINNLQNYLKEKDIDLPNTLSATSGKGGKHYYFKTNIDIKTRTNYPCKGVDIRGKGGLIIAPPSIHENGNRYKWNNSFDIAPLPPILETILQEDISKSTKKNKQSKNDTTLIENDIISIGERNITLFKIASKLFKTGLSYEVVSNFIQQENKNRCEEPLKQDELKILIDSSFKYCQPTNNDNKIFGGKYKPTTIAIYWLIWNLCLETLNGKIYYAQRQLCDMLGIKNINSLTKNMKPLLDDDLIRRELSKNKNSKYPVYSYYIL